MNEGIQFSKLASKLLLELIGISDDDLLDESAHSRSIEAILSAFEDVDRIVSMRKPDADQSECPADDDEAVN